LARGEPVDFLKPKLLVIFLTVLIDLIGFGIVLPLLPRYSERFAAPGWLIGVIIASFSVMQFFCAPWWGRLSDRVGRRPVLLLSNAGSALSYVLFAVAALDGLTRDTALGLLLTSRVFAGLCGANISVASAYIADITPRESRSKGMGLIGMAFGLGFILGPALGAVSAQRFGLAGPGWVAAGLCALNFALACVILAESRQPGSESAATRPRLAQWTHTLRQPKVGLLIALYFVSTFCFVCFESTLPLLLGSPSFHPDDFVAPRVLARKLADGADPVSRQLRGQLPADFVAGLAGASSNSPARLRRDLYRELNRLLRHGAFYDASTWRQVILRDETRRLLTNATSHEAQARLNRLLLEDAYPSEIKRQSVYFDERHVGYLFAYCGLVSAFIQGGLLGRLVKRFGEPRLIVGSLLLFAVGLGLIPYAESLAGLLVSLALLSGASGVNRPPTMGLISVHSPAAEQGATLGVAQSAGTLARIAGPVFATSAYMVMPHSPYVTGAVCAVAAAGLAWRGLCAER
jgi:MFS family permease